MADAPPLARTLRLALDALLGSGLQAAIDAGRQAAGARDDDAHLRSISAHVDTAEWKSLKEAVSEAGRPT